LDAPDGPTRNPRSLIRLGFLSFWVSGRFLTSHLDGATFGATGGGRGPVWWPDMRHINYVLKPATIDNAKPKDKRYDLTDGGGLVLEVMASGSKTWRFETASA